MFSSENQNWATRWNTFYSIQEQLGRKYNLDPCCFKETAKCNRYITESEDIFSYKDPLSLKEELGDLQIFVNPPYGRYQAKFVNHIADWCEYEGVIADCLIPSRTDTGLFHDDLLKRATTIRFIKGRLTFGDDAYWEWFWRQEYRSNGTKNKLFGKVGKMEAATFPSIVVSFGEDKEFSFERKSLIIPKEVYTGNL